VSGVGGRGVSGRRHRVGRGGAGPAERHDGGRLPPHAAPQRALGGHDVGVAARQHGATAEVALHEQRGFVDVHAPPRRPALACAVSVRLPANRECIAVRGACDLQCTNCRVSCKD